MCSGGAGNCHRATAARDLAGVLGDLAGPVAGRARRVGRGGADEPAWGRPWELLLAIAAAWSYLLARVLV